MWPCSFRLGGSIYLFLLAFGAFPKFLDWFIGLYSWLNSPVIIQVPFWASVLVILLLMYQCWKYKSIILVPCFWVGRLIQRLLQKIVGVHPIEQPAPADNVHEEDGTSGDPVDQEQTVQNDLENRDEQNFFQEIEGAYHLTWGPNLQKEWLSIDAEGNYFLQNETHSVMQIRPTFRLVILHLDRSQGHVVWEKQRVQGNVLHHVETLAFGPDAQNIQWLEGFRQGNAAHVIWYNRGSSARRR